MIQLEPHPDGGILAVKAAPGSRRNEIRGVHDGALKVAVTAAPDKGKANRALIAFLAEQLQLKRAQIELLSGETDSRKRFLLRGIDAATWANCLNRLLANEQGSKPVNMTEANQTRQR